MVAVERVREYSQIQPEENVGNDRNLLKNWPEKGEIVITKASFRYHPTLPSVLNRISIHIKPSEKVFLLLKIQNICHYKKKSFYVWISENNSKYDDYMEH